MTETKTIIELTDSNFKLIDNDPISVVKFWMNNCGPCTNMAPVFEAVAKDNTDTKFYSINKDDANEIGQKLGINNFPTLVVFKKGQEVARIKPGPERYVREKLAEAKTKEPEPPMTLEKAYLMKGEAITNLDIYQAKLTFANKFIYEALGMEVRENPQQGQQPRR